jgi:hypothetical protein
MIGPLPNQCTGNRRHDPLIGYRGGQLSIRVPRVRCAGASSSTAIQALRPLPHSHVLQHVCGNMAHSLRTALHSGILSVRV